MLSRLGYDDSEAAALVAASDRKLAKAQRQLETDRIRVTYLDGKISRADASAQLDQVGVTPAARQAYLLRWDAEQERARPDLSVAQVKDLVATKVWAAETARSYLLSRGWLPADVDSLFRLWGAKEAAAVAKAAAPKPRAPRKPTTGTLASEFLAGIIDRTAYLAGLTALGFGGQDAERMVRTTEAKKRA